MTSSTGLIPRRSYRLRWWPIYLLGVLAVLLIAGDWALPLPEFWRSLLLVPVTAIVCALVLRWTGRNEGLMTSEGADARVRRDPILEGMIDQAAGVEISPQTSLFVVQAGDGS